MKRSSWSIIVLAFILLQPHQSRASITYLAPVYSGLNDIVNTSVPSPCSASGFFNPLAVTCLQEERQNTARNALNEGQALFSPAPQALHRLVAVFSQTDDFSDKSSNPTVGLPEVSYLAPSPYRGLERAEKHPDQYSIVSPQTIEGSMSVTHPNDWLRVITIVPEPNPALLLGAGLIALVILARRRKIQTLL